MDKVQAYQRAIQILAITTDFKDLVYKIAVNNPEALVNQYDGKFLDFIADLYVNQGKIPAIKEYRAAMNASLKDSKDAVETLAKERNLTPREYP
jgi:ribosomal protein L7/L12